LGKTPADNVQLLVLLNETSYKGNPPQSHLHLPIERTHFAQWIKLFQETVDAHFSGEKADETKMRAKAIAGVFQHKMGLMKPDINR
jgi:hemoglobin